MPKKRDFVAGAILERKLIQKEITERFGEEAVLKARERLCSNCAQSSCFLVPLTSKGGDCPYFEQKEGEE